MKTNTADSKDTPETIEPRRPPLRRLVVGVALLSAGLGVVGSYWGARRGEEGAPGGSSKGHLGSVGPGSRTAVPALRTGSGEEMRPGFRLDPRASKFALGEYLETRVEHGFERRIGTQGVIGTRLSNGWTMSIPNGNAPSLDAPALTRDSDIHNQHVLNYFTTAGLPADQVEGVNVLTTGTSARGPGLPADADPFVAYTSRIDRTIDGLPVPDSNAWARFNANGQVVTEGAYWPEVPESVVQQASAFRELMNNADWRRRYEAMLPPDRVRGEVAIRHSSSVVDRAPQFFAVYDVVQRLSPGVVGVRHFDVEGKEVRLPQEMGETLASAADSAAGRK